ncbi:EfeM/EfeO family lipoprotein [Xenorhabdus budapestensis]|uniref:EfeM/EfeO family lipoprotein n=1 Tax=Xenorhabdus budapestensis TaxID=290110 RepID=A0A2D0J2U3_XENBU|nr:EfeM/EfeO family lipoprotein [Xenorhabdus budapestensis]PHM28713.1 ferrous iron transporter [Xenorhabdus budapestensis]QTL38256.1 EfeM/EfeO family lipoprotein [Xenorhabdus budapestensis]
MLRNTLRMTVSLLLLLSLGAGAEKYRAGLPNIGNEIVIAKGDIPTPTQYQPMIAAYMKTMGVQVAAIEAQLITLQGALNAGNWQAAQQAYIQAHYDYETIRAVVVVFGHADRVINPHASYFLEQERDPKFIGFHRVEYALFSTNDKSDALAATQALLRNVQDLKQRVAVETLPIAKLVQSADDSIELILETKLGGDENRYSRSDLADIAANLQGARWIVDGLAPFLPSEIVTSLNTQFDTLDSVMANYRSAQGQYFHYEQLSHRDKQQLYAQLTQLAEALSGLRTALKIDVYYKYRNEP